MRKKGSTIAPVAAVCAAAQISRHIGTAFKAHLLATPLLLAVLVSSMLLNHPARADGDSLSLWESHDRGLQEGLDQIVASLGLRDAVREKKLCLTLVDITDPSEPRLAEANGNHMMYAASLPKIAILFAAFQDIERGRLALDPDLEVAMTDMIRVSSNEQATAVLERVGTDRINQILQAEPFRLYDRAVGGGLWVGKAYAKGTAYERDPLHNISHGATAIQAARFYQLLDAGEMVNPKLTTAMRAILAEPAIEHKFVKGLKTRPNARLFRKSGSWRQYHADSALVENLGHRFIMVALAEDAKGGEWLEQLAAPMHDLIVSQQSTVATR